MLKQEWDASLCSDYRNDFISIKYVVICEWHSRLAIHCNDTLLRPLPRRYDLANPSSSTRHTFHHDSSSIFTHISIQKYNFIWPDIWPASDVKGPHSCGIYQEVKLKYNIVLNILLINISHINIYFYLATITANLKCVPQQYLSILLSNSCVTMSPTILPMHCSAALANIGTSYTFLTSLYSRMQCKSFYWW